MSGEKAYIVTIGCYSDYRILGVFADRQTAEAFIARYRKMHGGNGYDHSLSVEEWPVQTDIELYRSRRQYIVHINEVGEEVERRDWFEEDWKPGPDEVRTVRPGLVRAASFVSYEHALKIARDRLAQNKARRAKVA
jgi:hypothetical protein